VLRKCPDVTFELVPRAQYDFTPERRARFKKYADIRFGNDVMGFKRLDALFASQVVSHLMVFTDTKTGAEIGTVVLHIEGDAMAYYYYGFYELDYPERSLGLYMMTSAVAEFAARGTRHLYLGTCYSQKALYKTQFPGVEFFNGFSWSQNLKELKFLLQRDKPDASQHLLDTEEFRQLFYENDLTRIQATSRFRGTSD
jgi:arginyl-tRNA--protein-N-Asp/Glu arginylyltransferase